ncbi:MAG: hypothetical protein ACREEE_08340, partial [Dongiaceae bacterium]
IQLRCKDGKIVSTSARIPMPQENQEFDCPVGNDKVVKAMATSVQKQPAGGLPGQPFYVVEAVEI